MKLTPRERLTLELFHVADKHPGIEPIELPEGTAVFPVYGASGGLSSNFISYLFKGQLPSSFDFGRPRKNDYEIFHGPGWAYAAIEWSSTAAAVDIVATFEKAAKELAEV